MHPPVDDAVYVDMAKELGRDYAMSYLGKAGQRGNSIWPFTLTAYNRLRNNFTAMAVLNKHKVRLEKPEPYHEGRSFMGDTPPALRRAA